MPKLVWIKLDYNRNKETMNKQWNRSQMRKQGLIMDPWATETELSHIKNQITLCLNPIWDQPKVISLKILFIINNKFKSQVLQLIAEDQS
jgi:hypothetical protein